MVTCRLEYPEKVCTVLEAVRHRSRCDTSALGLGCVKTTKLKFQLESSSRLRRFEQQKLWQTLLGEDNKENNSTRSSRSNVFTRPRSVADTLALTFGVRFVPENGRGIRYSPQADGRDIQLVARFPVPGPLH
jgi:hypothetical protein